MVELGISLAGAIGLIAFYTFRAFTPVETFVVEYVSPKIDPPELRDL